MSTIIYKETFEIGRTILLERGLDFTINPALHIIKNEIMPEFAKELADYLEKKDRYEILITVEKIE